MTSILADISSNAAQGHVYATLNDAGRICLVPLGTYSEVRHRYNQMACLIGAVAMEGLLACSATSLHSRSAPPGAWFDRTDSRPLGTPGELFSLGAGGPSEGADRVGRTASYDQWPQGMTVLLSGYKAMAKSMTEIGNVFYSYEFKPTAQAGCSQDVSAAKRAKEAIARAKKIGYAIYEEDALLRFLRTLETARSLHFFHQVS